MATHKRRSREQTLPCRQGYAVRARGRLMIQPEGRRTRKKRCHSLGSGCTQIVLRTARQESSFSCPPQVLVGLRRLHGSISNDFEASSPPQRLGLGENRAAEGKRAVSERHQRGTIANVRGKSASAVCRPNVRSCLARLRSYSRFAYSTLASFSTGTSGSASFQSVRKS
jgi:hypothetical protein